ncbi:putative Ig domain-containing protein [Ramlibacter montanisoli]|uniref:Fibronectin type-III domain-containing protein n=1 Tax=Ramlibacter montanisoli TaxID=2732512 RepID=A0A849KE53_9BURK|nr:WD40 repeat domain-containing protein [Ramlibacter montanisoli]NNU43756.1 hypothetical protein [Ramlibacter montanisoli]
MQAGSRDWLVQWEAGDEPGGSGVRHTTVYVRAEGGNWSIWQRQTQETQAVYEGEPGTRYEFLALSVDLAGNRELPPGSDVPSDGTVVDVGGTPEVGRTSQDVAAPPPASNTAPTNELFVQAQANLPALQPLRPSLFTTVIAPFGGEAFGTGVGQSFSGIGPLALLDRPDGSYVVSGGGNRGALYVFDQDGGHALAPAVQLDSPVFDLAWDGHGGLWATSGGGQLLELDPTSLAIINRYGDSLTQALAFDAANNVIFVSSGDGIERFDLATRRFSHFSNSRVDDLAIAPDGSLWATAWPRRGDVLSFDHRGRAQVQLRMDAALDSLAFGRAGTALEGLLFVSARIPSGSSDAANLYMVDLATMRVLEVARGGPSAEQLLATGDGRLLIANGAQVDVLAPMVAPLVVSVGPPDGALVPLPLPEISVVFDHDMLADSDTLAASVTNPANYRLTSDGTPLLVRSVFYDAVTRTATLRFDELQPGNIELTVSALVRSRQGLALAEDFVSGFTAVSDFSALVRLDFEATRSDRLSGTFSYDVRVTNTSPYDLRAPLMLVIDPARYFEGALVGGLSSNGLWLIDLGVDGSGLAPGESTVVQTVMLTNPLGQRANLGNSIYALPYPNVAPLWLSTPVGTATVGQSYAYPLQALDPDGVGLRYLLVSGPDGMELDADTGVLRWIPDAGTPARANVALRAYDARGAFAQQNFSIDVAQGNRAPVLLGLKPEYTLLEGQLLHIAVDAVDPDGDTLSLSMDKLPAGAVFDPIGRVFEWVPRFDQAGIYSDVRFVASDGSLMSEAAIRITVLQANAPPMLDAVAPRTVREGDPIRIAFNAIDLDGDALVFTSPNLPSGAAINPNTGVFEWTPSFNQAGSYTIAIWVGDNRVNSEVELQLEVLNVNAAPEFDSFTGLTVAEGQLLSLRTFALDPDNVGFVLPDRLSTGAVTPLLGTQPTVVYSVSGLPPARSSTPRRPC